MPGSRQLNDGLMRPGDALSLPVHPTQLYSCAAGFVVLGLLLAYAPSRSSVRARSWPC